MKSALTILVVLAAGFLDITSGYAESIEGNMFKNPGFESIEANGMPTRWAVYNPSKEEAKFRTNPEAFKGKKCIFMEGATAAYHGGWMQGVGLQVGSTYKFSAWIKIKKLTEEPIKVKTLHCDTPLAEKAGKPYVGYVGRVIHEDMDWTYVENKFTVSADAYPGFNFMPVLLTGKAKVWIDEVSLVEVSKEELASMKEELTRKAISKHTFLHPGPVKGEGSLPLPTLGDTDADWWIEADIYAGADIPNGVMYFRKEGGKAIPIGRWRKDAFADYGLEKQLVTISYDVSNKVREDGRYNVIWTSLYGENELLIKEMRLCSRKGEKIIDSHKDFVKIGMSKNIFPYLSDPGLSKDIADADWWIEADVYTGTPPDTNGIVFLRMPKGDIVPIGRWTAGTISTEATKPTPIFYDVSSYIKEDGEYCIILAYTAGCHGLTVKEVRLCSRKGERITDGHTAWTGGVTRQNVYRFNLGKVSCKKPFLLDSIPASTLFSIIGRKRIATYSFLIGKDGDIDKTPQPVFVKGVDFARGNVGSIAEWDIDFPHTGIYDLYLLYASEITRQVFFYLDGKRINPSPIDGSIYGIPKQIYTLDYPRQVSTGSDDPATALWEKEVSGLKITKGYHILTMRGANRGVNNRNFGGRLPTILGLLFQPQGFPGVKESIPVSPVKAESADAKTSFGSTLDDMKEVNDWQYVERFGDTTGTSCKVSPDGVKGKCMKIKYSFNNKDKNNIQGADTCYFTKFGKWDLAEYAGLSFYMKGDGTDNRVSIYWVDNKGCPFCLGSFSLSKDSWQNERCNLRWHGEFIDTHNIREFRILLNEGSSKETKGYVYIDEMIFIPRDVPEDIATELTEKEIEKICGGLKKGSKLKAEVKKVCIEPVDPGKWSLIDDPVTREDLGTHFRGYIQGRDKVSLGTVHNLLGDPSRYADNAVKNQIYFFGGKPNNATYAQVLKKADKYFLGSVPFGEWDGNYFIAYVANPWNHKKALKSGLNPNYKTRKGGYEAFIKAAKKRVEDYPEPKRFMTISSIFTFQHYFAEVGCRLLGLETSQCLPSDILGYAFNRGAGKQYGILRREIPSIFNRFGYEEYLRDVERGIGQSFVGDINFAGGPCLGPTLKLLKRIWYTSYVGGTSIIGFEGSYHSNRGLSPVGKLQVEAVKWCKEHPVGEQYTPVALMLDHYHGWVVPRQAYTGGTYKVWGTLPYNKGDYQIDNFFRLIFPGYEDCSYYRNERGFLTATPYGDKFDVLLDNAEESVLEKYNLIILLGSNEIDEVLGEKLKRFVKRGGDIVLSTAQIGDMGEELTGVELTGRKKESRYTFSLSDRRYFPENTYIYDIIKPTTAKALLISENKDALMTVNYYGKGQVIVVAPEYWMTKELEYGKNNFEETHGRGNYRFPPPKYKILQGVTHILSDYFKDFDFVEIDGEPIQYAVNLNKARDRLVLTLVNNVDREWIGKVKVKGTKIINVNGLMEDKGIVIKGILEAKVSAGDVSVYEIKTDRNFLP